MAASSSLDLVSEMFNLLASSIITDKIAEINKISKTKRAVKLPFAALRIEYYP
jgi:hypothetical protein